MARENRFADSGLDFITIGSGICSRCKHVRPGGQKCAAFPKGIPADVLSGRRSHRVHIAGDNGIKFEAREG